MKATSNVQPNLTDDPSGDELAHVQFEHVVAHAQTCEKLRGVTSRALYSFSRRRESRRSL